MAAGDVTVTAVKNPTAESIDTALTAIRASTGAEGKQGMVSFNDVIFVWGIEEGT